jgi:hypothetical protein
MNVIGILTERGAYDEGKTNYILDYQKGSNLMKGAFLGTVALTIAKNTGIVGFLAASTALSAINSYDSGFINFTDSYIGLVGAKMGAFKIKYQEDAAIVYYSDIQTLALKVRGYNVSLSIILGEKKDINIKISFLDFDRSNMKESFLKLLREKVKTIDEK